MGSLILGGWDYQRIVPEKNHLSTHASAPQVPGAADGCIEDCHAKSAGRRRRGKVQSRQGPWPGVAFLAAAQRRCEGKNLQKKEELPSGKLAELKKKKNDHFEWVNHGKSTGNEFSIAMLLYQRV